MQLNEIAFLREQMRNVSDSDAFKAFEDLPSSIIAKRDKDSDVSSYEDHINQAVERILAEQVSQMQDMIADGVKLSEKLELVFEPSLPSLGGSKETELQREQLKKYRQMDTQLDKIEKLVGIWNPLNRYLTVY